MSNIPPLSALRAFEAAVRLGGFARAAAELNVSTSAVSHQIRSLEESLGARLLERSTGIGGIRLTPAGSSLLPAASGALSFSGQWRRTGPQRPAIPVADLSAAMYAAVFRVRREPTH